jgi:hypothetical protein
MASIVSRHGGFWRLVEAIRVSLCKMNQIQFEAPWKSDRRNCG